MNRFIKIIHLFSFPYIYTNLLGIMILESYPIFPSMSIGFLYFLKKTFLMAKETSLLLNHIIVGHHPLLFFHKVRQSCIINDTADCII